MCQQSDYRRDHQRNHSAGTLHDPLYLTISGFAENAEMVAVKNYIDVGNIPIKFLLGHCNSQSFIFFYENLKANLLLQNASLGL